jgi:glyoxylase-like metal-dependent hydrolase (beta-lactamase superfamily II)
MVTRLAPGVWWLDYQGTNAYLVEASDGEREAAEADDATGPGTGGDRGGTTVTLVDTGMPWAGRRLVGDVERVAGSVGAIDRVLITHFDFDHVGGLERLVAAGLDAPVAVGRADEPFLTGRKRPPLDRKGLFQRIADVGRSPPDLPVEPVADGDRVGGFEAYHTPGHTPGHTAFVHEGLSAAFVGDLVSERDGAFGVPPWVLNADQQRAEGSLTSFLDRAPRVELVCQGHGTPATRRGTDRLRGSRP